MGFNPHATIITVRNIKGEQALIIRPLLNLSILNKFISSPANLQIFFGFQYFKRISKLIIEPIPARISGKPGPIKFEQLHCINAKEIPDTKMAGKTSTALLQPDINITK